MIFNLFGFLKILLYKIQKKKIIVINEAAGLGDYLWVRNFFKLIKSSEKYKDYKIVFCAVQRWLDFAKEFDSDCVDVFLPFWNPYRPLINEIYILKIFRFDVFLNFRAKGDLWRTITNSVKADIVYDNINIQAGVFPKIYDERIISQMIDIPEDFRHTLEYKLTSGVLKKIPDEPYCILVPGGYTEGYLTISQLLCIIEHVYSKYKIKILITGLKKDYKIFKELKLKLNNESKMCIINGCGKFKTYELPAAAAKSEFILTTNTSMLHIAIMLNKKTFCFLSEYGCLNYRPELVKYITGRNHLSDIPAEKIIKDV